MYTFAQACILLSVSRSTLNRWLAAAEMTARPDPFEHRRFLISAEQLSRLATKHQRVIKAGAEAKRLEQRVALLELQVAMLLETCEARGESR